MFKQKHFCFMELKAKNIPHVVYIVEQRILDEPNIVQPDHSHLLEIWRLCPEQTLFNIAHFPLDFAAHKGLSLLVKASALSLHV